MNGSRSVSTRFDLTDCDWPTPDVEGELQTYTTIGSSGKDVHRHFCPECGSGIYLQSDAVPGQVFLKAGVLDDAGWVNPEFHIFTVAKKPWLHLTDSLPQHERMPPQ